MDVMFDNVFSDLAMHDKIKDSLASIQQIRQIVGVSPSSNYLRFTSFAV
jgi:hypothetical protein